MRTLIAAAGLVLVLPFQLSFHAAAADRVDTKSGAIQGTIEPDGLRVFKGIPFAAPPTGALRWQPPQPPPKWKAVRPANAFGAQCMQRRIYSDMVFRSNGTSEDCLYLNVWTPAKTDGEQLPVLIYFYGGGFVAGDGSEPRYDGESMARRGIVAVTVNYRLGVFGFFAHPELTKESPQHASGNQGLLDQSAALKWVQANIAAFGGDPHRVTIAGESAGSLSVSAQMASPLSKDLMAAAIGESGALINPTLGPIPLADAEQAGAKFGASAGAESLTALRAIPAEQLLEAAAKPGLPRFMAAVDGYFLPKRVSGIFSAGGQAHVPLLAGWNSEENSARMILGPNEATPENYAAAIHKLYGERADEVLKLYPGTTAAEVQQSATDLAGDRFIAFSTWKWTDLHSRTGGAPVYRYFYVRPRPPMQQPPPETSNGSTGNGPRPSPPRGAVHSAEIEYALGNLATNKVFAWTPDDMKLSELMQGYFANFIKTHDPNGAGLPAWPKANGESSVRFMRLDVEPRVETEQHRERYVFLDSTYANKD